MRQSRGSSRIITTVIALERLQGQGGLTDTESSGSLLEERVLGSLLGLGTSGVRSRSGLGLSFNGLGLIERSEREREKKKEESQEKDKRTERK